MKSLDEVITALEMCTADKCICLSGCPYSYLAAGEDSCEYHAIPAMQTDALHYLNEYRLQLDDIVTKRKILEYKIAQYEQMCETVQKHGQEHEDRLQAEIGRYMDAVKNCEDISLKAEKVIIDGARNDPLTWDELCEMEGKPVWIELLGNGHWKGWDVIAGFYEDDFGVAMVTVHNDDYYKADFGKTWKAYRKEQG